MPGDHAFAANNHGDPEKIEASQVQIPSTTNSFSGMDEAVNEKLAENAGLKPKDPLINIESMGDLWNAFLLIAGGICGFVIGRWWDLISKKKNLGENQVLDP